MGSFGVLEFLKVYFYDDCKQWSPRIDYDIDTNNPVTRKVKRGFI